MKVFTVYQPYAFAIVAGLKHYETRPRRTEQKVGDHMTIIKISASCPYEIGDKIVTGREIHPPELAFRFPAAVRTITDIVCQYSAQTGEAVFLYELDGREPLVRLEAPPRKKKQK